MNINIRYFASVRELMGTKSTQLDLDEGSTVSSALAAIADGDSRRERAITSCMTMVNQEYVQQDHVLRDGDELAG